MAALNTLKERIEEYSNSTNFKLLKRLPIIVTLNGRSFKKTTSLLDKPFCPIFAEAMCGVMIKLSQEIDGTIFAYSFNDEIVLIARNDQTLDTQPWYDNRIQKIVSVAASIATYEFNRIAKLNGMQIFGDPIFSASTFVVPNMMEAINLLIQKQNQAFHIALSMACFYELIKKHKPETVEQTLIEKSSQAKAEILFENCGIDINTLPQPFRRGFACYRAPKIINIDGDEKIKNKLTIDMELPIFAQDHEFLGTIFKSGRDIIRAK